MFVIIVHVFDFVINEFFVFILQILAMEHLFSYKRQIPRSGNKYPRIMHGIDVIVGDHELRLVCVRIWYVIFIGICITLMLF